MEITSFSPLIMTKDSEAVGEFFQALGFEKTHAKTATGGSGFRMKDADGHGVSIAQLDRIPKDMTVIQLNVRDLDEMISFLEARGFKNMSGDGKVIETGSSKTVMMASPSGFVMNVIYHERK